MVTLQFAVEHLGGAGSAVAPGPFSADVMLWELQLREQQ